MRKRHQYNLSNLNDEEVWEILNYNPSDDEDTGDDAGFDSDDEFTQRFMEVIEDSLPVAHIPPPTQSTHTTIKRKRIQPQILSREIFTGDVMSIQNDSKLFKSIIWKSKNMRLHENELVFRGEKELPDNLKVLNTPYDCFCYFVNEELLQEISTQSNLYAHQKCIQTKFKVDHIELRKFLGVLIFMSVYRYPNVRSYWGRHALEEIRETMTVLRFEEIRRYIHFCDNTAAPEKENPEYDNLYKIRLLVNHFNEKFLSVPMLSRLCVDEQMCATKMTGTNIRQYMPNKPHKWGFKIFTLCDSSGFCYSFEIYTGAGDNKIPEGAPDLGAASNVVVRLSKHIPNFLNHIIYFDNFYTSLGLITYLRSRGIFSLGTVRTNRLPNCKLASDETLKEKKVERGYSEEYVGNAYGVDISSVLWHDTKTVRLLSTYVGIKPFKSYSTKIQTNTVTRWDKKKKQHYEIDCPNIIKEYNRHMGGVDLMDGLLGRYHIRMKTRKWTSRIFYHLIDVAMVNSYILYHRLHPEMGKLNLPLFRTEVAESLCKHKTVTNKKAVGRPSISSPIASPIQVHRSYIPTEDIRYDQVGHWCTFRDRSGKKQCKFDNCFAETQAFCIKCKLSLCNSPAKNCFYKFHNK